MTVESPSSTVRVETQDHVATVTLARPDVRNALDRDAYAALEAIFHGIQRDAEVRCVILTGEDPAFCAGDDVRAIMTGEGAAEVRESLREVRPEPTPAASAILDCDRPLLAAVNGAAVGWGMDLSLFADIRIASEKAKFGELFVKRGLVSDVGGLWRLPRIVGPEKTAELLFTGEVIDAAEALRIGLVSRVVAHGMLLDAAMELAGKIAANPPLAVRHLKDGLRRGFWGDHREVGSWVGHTLGLLFATEDHREGVAAFLEKREPRFTGR